MSVRGQLPVSRLIRRRDGRWVAGVCNGLAGALGVPVAALRAVVVVLALGNLPAVALLYALAWAFLPPESDADGETGAAAGADGRAGAAAPTAAAGGLTIGGRPADAGDAVAVLALLARAVLLLGPVPARPPGPVVAP